MPNQTEMAAMLREVVQSPLATDNVLLNGVVRLAYDNSYSWIKLVAPKGLYLQLGSVGPETVKVVNWNTDFSRENIFDPIGVILDKEEVAQKQAAAYLHQRGFTPEKLQKRLSKFGLN
jgi:hypothetical protein